MTTMSLDTPQCRETRQRPGARTAAPALILGAAERRALAAFLAALFTLRLIALAVVPFTDSTEARYAEIARRMAASGDWITPWFADGVPFWGKPPLHTWLSAAGMKLFGVGEVGGRILIFAVAYAMLAGLFRWLAPRHGRDFALVSVAVLASTALFIVASAVVMTDLVMAAGVTLAMAGFWALAHDDDARLAGGVALFGGLAVGMLAKGPVAVVLTALPIGLWVVLGWRWSSLRRVPWLWGLAAFVLLSAPWYVTAELKTPGFLRYFFTGEHIERFLVSGWKGDLYGSGHAEPKGMIWAFWLIAALPWPLAALALAPGWRRISAAWRADAQGWRLFLLLWALAPMLLFTLAANILIPYVLPGLPAAAILFTQLWVDARGPTPDRAARRVFAAAGGLVLVVGAGAVALALAAPTVMASKSQKALVEAAAVAAPGAPLNVLGKSSFSAEFYTAGAAVVLPDAAALAAMLENDRRDALSVDSRNAAALPPGVLARLDRVGRFGRRVLFVERAEP
jgi:4-amino-4-deoxy-L-arabinose transferase-like glycosyltransferase